MSVPPPDHLSPSGWNLYETCPRQWADRYIDGNKGTVGWEAEVGTFAHAVLEWVMREKPANRTAGGARRRAGGLWRGHVGMWGMDPETDEMYLLPPSVAHGEITEADFKAKAWHAILGLWELEDPTQADVVATEERIEWTEGDVPMVAVVDRVDRHGRDSLTPGLVVLDYKTGSYKAKYQAKPKRQITIGALAVASQQGPLALAQAGSLLYVSADVPVAAPTDRSARQAVSGAAQGVWADIAQACAAEEFPATTSALCGWCDCVADCREGQSHIRRAESGGWSWYRPDMPGAKVVAALDAA